MDGLQVEAHVFCQTGTSLLKHCKATADQSSPQTLRMHFQALQPALCWHGRRVQAQRFLCGLDSLADASSGLQAGGKLQQHFTPGAAILQAASEEACCLADAAHAHEALANSRGQITVISALHAELLPVHKCQISGQILNSTAVQQAPVGALRINQWLELPEQVRIMSAISQQGHYCGHHVVRDGLLQSQRLVPVLREPFAPEHHRPWPQVISAIHQRRK
mmetsp:Transcript_140040/g.268512  ORF Transcript_140040/g.268512 Transcript_140040/m.268512 type:complete len:220 (+) Transcript_140040:1072-1731(+)